MKLNEINIRDPFVLCEGEKYYMYGTRAKYTWGDGTKYNYGFDVYVSDDLENWSEAIPVFEYYDGFYGIRDFWAPEVHKYNGKFYMFATFRVSDTKKGTAILISDTPDGKFVPLSNGPITPEGWECLDGTLFTEDGRPYMIFSHEWVQVGDGEIWAQELSLDLSEAIGEPFMLFRASDNPSVSELEAGSGNYVTDGPFLYREDGRVKMIWSSFYKGRYLVLDAESDSLRGKWHHGGSRFDFDGGHAMIFTSIDGNRMISLHAPNVAGKERAIFYEL